MRKNKRRRPRSRGGGEDGLITIGVIILAGLVLYGLVLWGEILGIGG